MLRNTKNIIIVLVLFTATQDVLQTQLRLLISITKDEGLRCLDVNGSEADIAGGRRTVAE